MGDEINAISEFKRSVHGKPLTRVAEMRQIANSPDWSKPFGGSTNIPVIALGALVHAGKETLARLGPMLAGENGWGIGGNEHGSHFYEQGWTAPVIMSFSARHAPARKWSLAFLAQHALSTVSFPRKLRVRVNSETAVREIRRWGSYKGPLSILPGPRYIWDWPSRRPTAPEIERGLVNPILQYAINASGRRWNQWSHHSLGFPMEALFGIGGTRYSRAPGALKDPESKAFLESFTKAAARPLVDRLNAYPLKPNRGVEWRYYADGSRAIMMKRSTHHTRGPCLVTIYDPGKKEVMCATASKPRAGGEWWAATASMDDTRWRSKMTSGDEDEISGPLPTAELLYSIRWSNRGCQIVGDVRDETKDDTQKPTPGPTPKPTPTPVPPNPEGGPVTAALLLLAEFADGSEDPWVQQGIRTAAEVVRRIAAKNKAGASQGAKALANVLES